MQQVTNANKEEITKNTANISNYKLEINKNRVGISKNLIEIRKNELRYQYMTIRNPITGGGTQFLRTVKQPFWACDFEKWNEKHCEIVK